MKIFDKNKIIDLLPQDIRLKTSNGQFKLNKSDCVVAPPQYQITYHHFTPDVTGDVLTDGEPDYLGFDVQMIANPKKCKCDITYGDAMMCSFDMNQDGSVHVGHYNGYNSKFDPNYEFYFEEDTINDLIGFFSNLTGFALNRQQFCFLDGDKNSFKMEKVNHRRIVDFRSFNPQGLL
jgi:hypothetical protein